MSARLEVVPSGLLSLAYEVHENGAPVGRIENRPLHLLEKGTVTANGREYDVLREGVFRANYLLRAQDGAIRAKAERKGWAGSAYLLLFDASGETSFPADGRRTEGDGCRHAAGDNPVHYLDRAHDP